MYTRFGHNPVNAGLTDVLIYSAAYNSNIVL